MPPWKIVQWKLRILNTQKTRILEKPNIRTGPDFSYSFFAFKVPSLKSSGKPNTSENRTFHPVPGGFGILSFHFTPEKLVKWTDGWDQKDVENQPACKTQNMKGMYLTKKKQNNIICFYH